MLLLAATCAATHIPTAGERIGALAYPFGAGQAPAGSGCGSGDFHARCA